MSLEIHYGINIVKINRGEEVNSVPGHSPCVEGNLCQESWFHRTPGKTRNDRTGRKGSRGMQYSWWVTDCLCALTRFDISRDEATLNTDVVALFTCIPSDAVNRTPYTWPRWHRYKPNIHSLFDINWQIKHRSLCISGLNGILMIFFRQKQANQMSSFALYEPLTILSEILSSICKGHATS